MARLPLATLVLTLLLAATAQAAPTGAIAGRDNGDGSWSVIAQATWDGCPAVCDWRIVADSVSDPAQCGQAQPRAGGYGMFGDKPAYTSNGTQVDGITGISRALPLTRDTTYVLCVGVLAVRKPGTPYPTSGTAEQQIQWQIDNAPPAGEDCVAPGPFAGTDHPFYGQCLQYVPLGRATVSVKGVKVAPYDPLELAKIKGTAGAGKAAAPKLTRTEAVKALRRKKLRGAISCKKVSAVKQRCTVKAKKRKRTYTVTESVTGVRVKRA